MRKFLFGLSLALMSCGPSALEEQVRNALPQKDGVALGNPQALARGTTATTTTTESHLAVGNASDYYQMTYDVTQGVNGSVGWVLDLVQGVVQWPPTKCGGDTCIWGPGAAALDPNTYQLTVTHQTVPTDRYLYALSAEPKSNPGSGFLTILSGWVVPSPLPNRGAGEFTIDFDEAQKLDHPGKDVGTLTAAYENFGPLAIYVTIQGANDDQHAGQKSDAVYQYADDKNGGGDLQVAAKNTTSNDTFTIHSRWLNTGAGRGDVSYNATFYNATVSECWSGGAFLVTYWHASDPNNLGADSGVETDCAFSPADFTNLNAP